MTSKTDIRLDELRTAQGRLFGSFPANEWVRPESVVLHAGSPRNVSLRDVLSGFGQSYIDFNDHPLNSDGPKLEITFHAPWSTAPPPKNRVRPHAEILDAFMALGAGSDEDIRAFASRYGGLLAFSHLRSGADDLVVVIESCEVWRYFAKSVKSLLFIGASLTARQTPNKADWDAIGECPGTIATYEGKKGSTDLLSPLPIEAQEAWSSMAYFVRRGFDRNKAMWTRLVNTVLALGRVRPWLQWDDAPRLVFTGPNLLSYVAMQLCLRFSDKDSFAVCSYCGRQYEPGQRSPKAGQRSFCHECRRDGAPVRLAQRDYRQRLRERSGSR
jgi:hypothetical protein